MKLVNSFYKIKKLEIIKLKDIVGAVTLIASIIILNLQSCEVKKIFYKSSNNKHLVIYNIIIGLAIVLISVCSILDKREMLLHKTNIKSLEEQNKNLLEVNDKVRCFRHDFNNIIQAIDGYIMLDDMGALQEYFSSLVSECNYINCIESLNYKIKGSPAVYGILLSKYRQSQLLNIDMNIEAYADLLEVNKKAYVVSRILGILLDNAIEASKETEEKMINVRFAKKSKRIDIIIENSYKDKNVDTNKIFEKGYSTKSENSGLGLWKVRDILKKDTSLNLFTSKDGHIFKQQFEIYI